MEESGREKCEGEGKENRNDKLRKTKAAVKGRVEILRSKILPDLDSPKAYIMLIKAEAFFFASALIADHRLPGAAMEGGADFGFGGERFYGKGTGEIC